MEAATVTVAATATNNGMNFKGTRRRRSLLTREVSNLSNSSILEAEYHAQEPAAVPFVWESIPGTPKRHVSTKSSSCHEFDHDLMLPPLTPPPSYQSQIKGRSSTTTRVSKKKNQNDANNNVNLIQSIFPRLSIKRDHPPTLSSSSSAKSSSPTSSISSSSSSSQSRQRLSFNYSSSPQIADEEEVGSPVSTLCFRRLSCFTRKFRGL
ncbi:Histone-lysine N-methyltransferase H3 lysine-36 specific [Bienertia sinuspersici]